MEKKVRVRVVQALVILALTLGVAGFSGPAEAHWPTPCYYLIGCEYCQCMEYRCVNGGEIPECGGNAACCSAALSSCWSTCIWY